jgi:predicted NBD/HSP70 family sugar kinase
MAKRAAQNALQMKLMNRLRVLRLIRRGTASRSELATETGLTRAAMSLIVADLVREGLLIETGLRRSMAGRKPVLLELRPGYAYSMGLTISRSGAEAGLLDLSGRLLYRAPIELSASSQSDAVHQIRQALRSLRSAGRTPPGRLLGLGISTPGPVDAPAGIILNPPNFDLWHDVRLCDKLKGLAEGRAFLENNSQALTMAEKAYGKGRECNSFVLLVVESGIGAGIMRGEERHSGWRGFGNEVGHTSINHEGPRCGCGLHGCVEVYASVPAVLARARKHHPRLQSWPEFVDLAHTGDAACRGLVNDQARALSTALVNVLNIFELEAVILTGDILYRGEMLRASVEREINQTAINRRLHHIPVHLSTLGEHSALRAAAGIATEKFFQGELEPDGTSLFGGRA